MQEKKIHQKYWQREREITFLWKKTMQKMKEGMPNL